MSSCLEQNISVQSVHGPTPFGAELLQKEACLEFIHRCPSAESWNSPSFGDNDDKRMFTIQVVSHGGLPPLELLCAHLTCFT